MRFSNSTSARWPALGCSLGNDLAPPVVPLPHQLGILGEGLGGGQFLRFVVFPESARAAKSGYAAFGRDPGPRQDGQRSSLREPLARLFEISHCAQFTLARRRTDIVRDSPCVDRSVDAARRSACATKTVQRGDTQTVRGSTLSPSRAGQSRRARGRWRRRDRDGRRGSRGVVPAGRQRANMRGAGKPAKMLISGTPQAAATCWPAES